MTIASAITAYFSGRIADKIGMRTMLVVSGVGSAFTIFGYTVIESLIAFKPCMVFYYLLIVWPRWLMWQK